MQHQDTNPLTSHTAHYGNVRAVKAINKRAREVLAVYEPPAPHWISVINIQNNEIWLPDAVNAIHNLTTLFRLLMRQQAIRPAYYEC